MNEFRALIVDDEALARVNIRQAIEPFKHWHVVGELHNGKELMTLIDQTNPDVIFLDIQMPGTNGMALAKMLMQVESCPHVVFVTAYDEYAVSAFELCAFDYLLKPFDDERFAQTIHRLEAFLKQPEEQKVLQQYQQQQLNSINKLENIIIRSIGSIRIIAVDNVFGFYACGNYVEVHHAEGMHLHRVSLTFLETQLAASQFCRVHRSAIVKLSEVKEIKTLDDNSHQLILSNGSEVKISSAYKSRLFDRLGL